MENKKVAVITGAANGIGHALSCEYADRGYALALADVDEEGLGRLGTELTARKADFLLIPGDLHAPEMAAEVIRKTVARWNRVDVLVNNAAWRTIETMRSISPETWEKTVGICLTAPAFLAKYAAAEMEKHGVPGVIINISSMMSQRAGGTSPAYIACKGAMESLTYELAVLYGPQRIRVLCINPGNIQTALSSDYLDPQGKNISAELSKHVEDLTPLRRAGAAAEVARACAWLCGDDASFITGTTITIDGGLMHNFNAYPMKSLQFPNEF